MQFNEDKIVESVQSDDKKKTIFERCVLNGLRMTDQRKIVAKVLSDSSDHPDVEELHRRALEFDRSISIATVYRTVKLFEEVGIIERLDFKDCRSRFEDAERNHHDHLIDIESGKVVEFFSSEIEAIQAKIAEQLGYRIVDHRLELYAVPIESGKG